MSRPAHFGAQLVRRIAFCCKCLLLLLQLLFAIAAALFNLCRFFGAAAARIRPCKPHIRRAFPSRSRAPGFFQEDAVNELFDGYAHLSHEVFEVPDLPFRSPNGSPVARRALSVGSGASIRRVDAGFCDSRAGNGSFEESQSDATSMCSFAASDAASVSSAHDCPVADFIANHDSGLQEYRKIADAFNSWEVSASPWRVTRWGKPAALRCCAARHGVDAQTRADIDNFLAVCKLAPGLSDLQAKHGGHYLVYEDGMLTTYMCTLTAEFKTNFKVAVSVEFLCSVSKNRVASALVEELKSDVLKRAQKSWVVTQALQRRKALRFWRGKLTQSSYACVLVGLMHIFDDSYCVHADCFPMCS